MASGAELIYEYLKSTQHVASAEDRAGCGPSGAKGNKTWTGFINERPSEPDNVVAVYDQFGMKAGRIMRPTLPAGNTNTRPGQTIIHPGYQLAVRATSKPLAQTKADQIADAFDACHAFVWTDGDGQRWALQTIVRDTDPVNAGPFESERYLFTINGRCTTTKLLT